MTDQQYETPEPDDEDFTFDAPPLLPAGVYPGTLTGFNKKLAKLPNDDGSPRYFIVWKFSVTHQNGLWEVEGVTSTWVSSGSKAYPWLVALLGAEAVQGMTAIDPKKLKGKRVQVIVVHNDEGYAKVDSLAPMTEAPAIVNVATGAQLDNAPPTTTAATAGDPGPVEDLPF